MSAKYLYWPVAGAAVFWREPYGLKRAKAALASLREQWPDIEIERVLLLNNNARRYWRWRGGRWLSERHYDPQPSDLAHWFSPAERPRMTTLLQTHGDG